MCRALLCPGRVPLSVIVPLDRARLKTPSGPLGVLCEPRVLRETLSSNPHWNRQIESVCIGGRSLADWRGELRSALNLAEPVIVTGHQVEFFHAGVLAKVIAADALSKFTGGSALFAAVDSDTPKSTRLAATRIAHGAAQRVDVVIPGVEPDIAMEAQAGLPREQWIEFFARVADFTVDFESSALRSFADGWLGGTAERIAIAPAMARGHEAVQTALGIVATPHVAISRFCETPAFEAFVAHIATHAERFAATYNAAQARYRARHHVRTTQRPVPPLTIGDQRVELPFWLNDVAGRRQRLFVDRAGQYAIDGESPRLMPVQPLSYAKKGDAHRVRPRALSLTLFLRLFVADVFIHGIGGAKYDEITDEIAREFFGVEAAPMACVSATLSLHGGEAWVTKDDIASSRRVLRDLRHNPQRYVEGTDAALAVRRYNLLQEATRLRAVDRLNRTARLNVHKALRAVHDEMLAAQPWLASSLAQRVDALLARQRDEQLREDREAFYGLHSMSALHQLVDAVRDSASS